MFSHDERPGAGLCQLLACCLLLMVFRHANDVVMNFIHCWVLFCTVCSLGYPTRPIRQNVALF